jgi:hypothetical protein
MHTTFLFMIPERKMKGQIGNVGVVDRIVLMRILDN